MPLALEIVCKGAMLIARFADPADSVGCVLVRGRCSEEARPRQFKLTWKEGTCILVCSGIQAPGVITPGLGLASSCQ